MEALEYRIANVESFTRQLAMIQNMQTSLMQDMSLIKRPENPNIELEAKLKEIEAGLTAKIQASVEEQFRAKFEDETKAFKDKVLSDMRSILDELNKNAPIDKLKSDRLQRARNRCFAQILGDSKLDFYKIYINYVNHEFANAYHKRFGVVTYAGITNAQFEDAINFTTLYKLPKSMDHYRDLAKTDYAAGKFDTNLRRKRAYESYFGITPTV